MNSEQDFRNEQRYQLSQREKCEMCNQEMEQADYDFCDICPDCLEEIGY